MTDKIETTSHNDDFDVPLKAIGAHVALALKIPVAGDGIGGQAVGYPEVQFKLVNVVRGAFILQDLKGEPGELIYPKANVQYLRIVEQKEHRILI